MFLPNILQPKLENVRRILLCFIGPNGSGKGTQSDMAMDTLHYLDFVPGQVTVSKLLEKHGPEITAAKRRGDPVETGFVSPLVRDCIARHLDEGGNAIVTDGFPRYDTEQADDFAGIADFFGLHVIVCLLGADHVLCEQSMIDRAKRDVEAGREPRPDDLCHEARARRLKLYFQSEDRIVNRLERYHRFPVVRATRHADSTPRQVHAELVSQIWTPEIAAWVIPKPPATDPRPAIGREIFEPGFLADPTPVAA